MFSRGLVLPTKFRAGRGRRQDVGQHSAAFVTTVGQAAGIKIITKSYRIAIFTEANIRLVKAGYC